MPIYSFYCNACGAAFDLLVGVNIEGDPMQCKQCSSKDIKKVFSTFGVGIAHPKMLSTHCSPSGCPTGGCQTCPGAFQ